MVEELPFAGVSCNNQRCKFWWLATIKGTIVEAEAPVDDVLGACKITPTIGAVVRIERCLKDLLKDSKVRLKDSKVRLEGRRTVKPSAGPIR